METPGQYDIDLAALGLEEIDNGVIEDTFENRQVLRANQYKWQAVYDTDGSPTTHIRVIHPEALKARSALALSSKSVLLQDPRDINSDYETGEDLLLISGVDDMIPRWIVSATKEWIRVRNARETTGKEVSPAIRQAPGRCEFIKSDGNRCQLWHSGRTDHKMCKTHSGSNQTPLTSQIIDRARTRLGQASIAAVDQLEHLMQSAESEPVRLKATTEILDRTGIRGGVEIDSNLNIEVRPAESIILERLEKLRKSAALADQKMRELEEANTEDAVIVVEEQNVDKGETDTNE